MFLDDVSSNDLQLSSDELYKYDRFCEVLKKVISKVIYEEFGLLKAIILVDGVKSWSKMRRILSMENGGMNNLGKVELVTQGGVQSAMQSAIQSGDKRQP